VGSNPTSSKKQEIYPISSYNSNIIEIINTKILYQKIEVTKKREKKMVEPLLSGIVLGLVPVTALGLFVAAFLQYRRGNQLGI